MTTLPVAFYGRLRLALCEVTHHLLISVVTAERKKKEKKDKQVERQQGHSMDVASSLAVKTHNRSLCSVVGRVTLGEKKNSQRHCFGEKKRGAIQIQIMWLSFR